MEFLSDTNEAAAADVLEFVREAIQRFDSLRPLVIEKMLEVFHAIKTVKYGLITTLSVILCCVMLFVPPLIIRKRLLNLACLFDSGECGKKKIGRK